MWLFPVETLVSGIVSRFCVRVVVSSLFLSDCSFGACDSLFQAAAAVVDTFELFPADPGCFELFPCLFAAFVLCFVCHVMIIQVIDQ